ncbi:MAG: hypothetical protein HYZ28_04215 [Myxococcales bacterium]|nr:hypothetical protein [Myxococcales bacterium]
MGRTRMSFFYLAGYLWLAGLTFLAAPQAGPKLLLATGSYEPTFVRLCGGLMVGLGIIVVQIIRHRVEALYRTTLYVRGFFVGLLVWIYALTEDRMFLLILGVVLLGLSFTAAGFIADRRRASAPAR